MKTEKQADYYDKAYTERAEYQVHYTCSYYAFIWRIVLEKIKKIDSPKILELGCGTGQFAQYLWDNGFKSYLGIDFSEVGIKIAKEKSKQNFINADIYMLDNYSGYNLVILLEVLEHLDKDIELIDKIPAGVRIIFSVPTFDDPAHVRFFHNEGEVIERFKNVKINDVEVADRIILCDGIKL